MPPVTVPVNVQALLVQVQPLWQLSLVEHQLLSSCINHLCDCGYHHRQAMPSHRMHTPPLSYTTVLIGFVGMSDVNYKIEARRRWLCCWTLDCTQATDTSAFLELIL